MSKNTKNRAAVREQMKQYRFMMDLRFESFSASVKDDFPMDASDLARSVNQVAAAQSVLFVINQEEWEDVQMVDHLLSHVFGAADVESAKVYAQAAKTLLGYKWE